MKKYNFVKIQSVLALISFIVLFTSILLQYVGGLHPCPLCLMQRLCVFVLLCLMGLSYATLTKAHFISLLQIIISGLGLFLSLRQLWLQSLPAGTAPACLPGLDILIKYFPWQTVAKALFWGSGDCAEAAYKIYNISLPGWGAMYFVFVFIISLYLYLRTRSFT